ncbi:NlpC/P60 family protein [Tessaracoccus sp. OS52]|uniref:C40 family peptidase n=1 Tax=Tessaracoccus sp. OS52 TaxID=2886691 RepID=UPI001D0F959B|nr:C40 family peptidase [Tessaracoccus sp. OS52]MCC2593422.1 NlpC/P60 family protein [Tessaracoccus sp. OS52]
MKKFRLALVALLSVATLMGFVGQAAADPDAVSRAKDELDRIHQESSAIDQQIIEAIVRADEAAEKLEQLQADLSVQEAKVDAMASALGAIAVIQFQSGGFDVTAQLLTSDSEASFLSSLATIQNEADRSNADLQALQVGQARVERLRAEADRTNASLQADLSAKEQLAKQYDAKEAEAEAVYKRLDAEEKERLRQLELERQRQQELADQRALEAAAAASRSRTEAPAAASGPAPAAAATEATEATVSGSASSRALGAVAAAKAQVGKRYVWGTSGPNTFDCSGLTSFAYRQVGINLTRSSRAQASLGTKVAKSDLQPGDLVFYYSPISHVGIYIGNGKIVDAANPRTGVRITSLNSMPFTTARRVA